MFNLIDCAVNANACERIGMINTMGGNDWLITSVAFLTAVVAFLVMVWKS
jgi:hypothetical protein